MVCVLCTCNHKKGMIAIFSDRHLYYLRMKLCRTLFHRCMSSTTEFGISTIFALSTAPGKAAVAVIRISGPRVKNVLSAFTAVPVQQFDAKRLRLVHFRCPSTGELLDKGLAVFFPSPHSYTGEDCCELHVHGGTAVVSDILDALGRCADVLPAEPGEFTKRAFRNGKLDLTEVEGIADLINAETSAQRRLALLQADGALRELYGSWRQRLLVAVAHVEAFIDFAEDEILENALLDEVKKSVQTLIREMQHHLADHRSGERLRAGVHVTIVGRPNAGKSSLLNLLCQRPAAIVTPIPGTTRDTLEFPLNLGGYPVVLTDTAGLRETEDVVEREGVRRAKNKLKHSDVVVCLVDASSDLCRANLDTDIAELLVDLNDCENQPQILVVFNKCDLLVSSSQAMMIDRLNVGKHDIPVLKISCITRDGITQLLDVLLTRVKHLCERSLAHPTITQARHRTLLTICLKHLLDYERAVQLDLPIGAQKLRSAIHNLGKITGQVGVEEILDTLFRDFCIGK